MAAGRGRGTSFGAPYWVSKSPRTNQVPESGLHAAMSVDPLPS